jgi:hypothetical protein
MIVCPSVKCKHARIAMAACRVFCRRAPLCLCCFAQSHRRIITHVVNDAKYSLLTAFAVLPAPAMVAHGGGSSKMSGDRENQFK